ncbi:hypothetical protein AAHN97_16070 [Chitinophaga niabensis]|uniref:hypothetical protein n=1 Tax=Chitinophaga niabensis TaxID=536979 RepID=UPI0031BA8BB7
MGKDDFFYDVLYEVTEEENIVGEDRMLIRSTSAQTPEELKSFIRGKLGKREWTIKILGIEEIDFDTYIERGGPERPAWSLGGQH